MRTGAPDLDDVEELIAADTDGLLPSVALAGAQVRAISEAQREGVLEPLSEVRPRSVVIVCGATGTAASAARLVVAAVGSRIDVPVIYGPVLPGWIGPLDVVVVAGDDAGDMALADAAARSLRRRAEVVIAAPVEGPLRDALGGSGIDLSPRVPANPRFRFIGFVATLLAVFAALTQVRFTGQMPVMADLADALDDEASTDHPANESFHNRAKSLAARLDGREAVWVGDSASADVIAEHAAQILIGVAGQVTAVAEMADVPQLMRLWAAGSGSAPTDSLFYDPDFDGPAPAAPPRIMVATTAGREWFVRRRLEGFADIDVLIGEEAADAADPAAVSPPVPAGDVAADGPAELRALLLLALRVEMAAVYLRLTRSA